MNPFTLSLLAASALFLGLIALLEYGQRLGLRRRLYRQEEEGGSDGLGALNGAIFGLMGLLVAFTFSSAASRFDARRDLITREANILGTAWLRLDLLPTTEQPALRDKLQTYVDTRIATYRALPDLDAARSLHAKATALQSEIWQSAVRATAGDQRASMLLLPAVNDLIDITTIRTTAMKTHPPTIIFILLIVVTLACALLAGYGLAGRRPGWRLHMFTFALILSVSVYVILDLEFPRVGLIRIDGADQLLVEVREGMR